jgi:hypothetical protein
LGFILGDEASGTYFGKKLLADFLYKRMPIELSQQLRDDYQLDKEAILNQTYRNEKPNVFLAGFMEFLSINRTHYYVKKLLIEGISSFAAIHIWAYPNFRQVPVHFVGSVAYHFQEFIQIVASQHGFTLGKVIQKPIDSIASFHLSQNH